MKSSDIVLPERRTNVTECSWFPQEIDYANFYLFGNFCSSTTSTNLSFLLPTDDEGLYEVPTGMIVLLSIFYGSISVISVLGNVLVMWIVATSKRMHNVTHYFIANLALADIVIGLFSIPFQAALLQRWNLPHFMCPFCPFVQVLSVSVSIFTLTAIAVDRHRAVLNPLKARPSKLRAKLTISGVWTFGTVLAVPMASALRVTDIVETDLVGRMHVRPFCQNVHFSDSTMMYYRFLLFLLQYAMPLCIITWAYARMAHRLWRSRAPGNAEDARDANIMKNKKKVIKMLVIVVALFALCWLPLQTYNVLQDIFPEINKYRYINIVWFCFDWLAMSNSCYNPFIYGIYNEKFKREFQIRFPAFRSRQWQAAYNSDSIDLDRTGQSLLHSRVSVQMSQTDASDECASTTYCHFLQIHSRAGHGKASKNNLKLKEYSPRKNYFGVKGGSGNDCSGCARYSKKISYEYRVFSSSSRKRSQEESDDVTKGKRRRSSSFGRSTSELFAV